MPSITPPRLRGIEYLDADDVDPALVRRSLDDVALANRLFGGSRAVLAELGPALASLGQREVTLLDVGTGAGDIPALAGRRAARRGVLLTTIGLDASEALASKSRPCLTMSVCGDALALPFADRSVDIVTCSQVLHHFREPEALRLICEMDRVARHRVIVSELRRSWLAAAGIWLVSFPLRFHPVSRHDGVVSVMRGFTAAELRETVRFATSRVPAVRRRLGWRVTASWQPRWSPQVGGVPIATAAR